MPSTLFFVLFALLLVLVGGAAWFAWEVLTSARKKELMGQFDAGEAVEETFDYDRPEVFISRSEMERRQRRHPLTDFLGGLEKRIAAAGLDWSSGGLLLGSLALAGAGAILGYLYPLLLFRWLTAATFAAVLGALPFLHLNYQTAKRMRQFEEQFPEALDFIARSLRAGHAFSASLEMLANEAPEPLCTEFRRVFQEQNLGMPLENTLAGLAQRVPIVDVKFFVSAVQLQREAGGNLSEILQSLAHTVRERFRLKGHVQAATAAARVTAIILSMIPLFVFVSLQLQSPEYIGILTRDPLGPILLLYAVLGQLVGYLVMRKMINFRF